MARLAHVRLRNVRLVYELLGELYALRNSPGGWLRHLLVMLPGVIGSDQAMAAMVSFEASRDPQAISAAAEVAGERRPKSKKAVNLTWQRLYREASSVSTDGVGNAHRSKVPRAVTRPASVDRAITMRLVSPCEDGYLAMDLHRFLNSPPMSQQARRMCRLLSVGWARMIERNFAARVPTPLSKFPPRQREVLKLILKGQSEKQIAAKLQVSPHTVHNHLRALHKRLNVVNRAELLAVASGLQPFTMPGLHLPSQTGAEAHWFVLEVPNSLSNALPDSEPG